MSSSQSSALNRARSLRKPTTRSDMADHNNVPSSPSQQRSTSPSRLPVKPPSSTSTTTGTGPVSERTLRRAVGEVRGSRPLSGVFGRMTSGSSTASTTAARQPSSSTNPDSSTVSSRLGRTPSIRQVSSASANPDSSTTPGTNRLTRAASIRQSLTTSARSGVSDTGSSIAPPRRSATTTTEQPTSLSRRPTFTEATANSTTSRRPTTSSGLPPRRIPSTTTTTTTPGSHSRAKSSVTTLTTTTILRPPSSTSQNSTATSTSTDRNDRSKPPITRSTAAGPSHKRAPSHPIPNSSIQPSTPGSGISRTKSLKLEGPGGVGVVKARVKPEFTTHQQHFSPLKNPGLAKPLTSAILAPPSPSKLPGNVAISAETARLQTELLQLSLLHSSAGEVKRQWEDSAYNKLREKFERVVEQEKEVLKLENRSVESKAVKELLDWGKGRGGLEERVRVLDEVLGSIWALTEPYTHNHKGGRYIRLVKQFERWLNGAEQILSSRARGETEGEELIAGIGQDWKEEIGSLSRKIHSIRQDLYGVLEGHETKGDGDGKNLRRVLTGTRELVEGMVQEVEIMEVVEGEVREREMEWVRGVNRADEGGGGAGLEKKRRAGAVWRAF
ncbi:hypothetical protein QBC36DRAFT_379515 [Triangularia setosa]|uniref:Uncharacterized protein n=1 Tax=Triangularia setosa TaxID=2587417 RepID=A0AAN7A6L6_9PEZI|nr:hypothetical protein QBC36DRAFT_379515 [Podospora setosa]